jgi:hypothetical protein
VDILKLQSKILIWVYKICAIVISVILSIILIFGVQSINDKVFLSIFMGLIALLCIIGRVIEIKHYVVFRDQNVVVKNRLKTHEILLKDLRKIEVYEPVQEDSRYLSMYKNKLIFITDDQKITFVYYTFRKSILKKEITDSFGNKYIGKLISKKTDDQYLIIYEFVGSVLLSLISLVGIVVFSINYTGYLYLSIVVLMIGVYLSYRYYSKLKQK